MDARKGLGSFQKLSAKNISNFPYFPATHHQNASKAFLSHFRHQPTKGKIHMSFADNF